MNKLVWKIGGEAGFGIMTTGLLFSKLASRSGFYVFDYVEYPSLIRGGHNTYEVVIDDKEVWATKKEIDILVCLNKETYRLHKKRLHRQSLVLYDHDEFELDNSQEINIDIPFEKIIREYKGKAVMKNIISLGASTALLGEDIKLLYAIILDKFEKKGDKVIEFNKKFAKAGYDHVKKNYSCQIKRKLLKPVNSSVKIVATGNEAFSLGAVMADCRFYSAYPMTPASSVLTTLAKWQMTTGMVVRHSEDEIGVINNALGASFAGARSAVGTSGGGFALMVESISLAGMTELPIVIFLVQRPGPATGMPTWTEQGDLLFAVYAGHGEFPKIVIAPGDVAEMLEMTINAFNLADIYQTPVIIISDKFLSESHKNFDKQIIDRLKVDYKVNRGKTVFKPITKPYLRYKVTSDGISERLIPGVNGYYYQANSYEHLEDGHTSEEIKIRKEQLNKRNRKIKTYLKNDFNLPKIYGNFNQAKIVFVSWGSTKGSIIEAQTILKKQNIKTAFIHFTYLHPLDKKKVVGLFKEKKRYILIENNFSGQFGKLLQQETGVNIKERWLKFDGRPFWPEEIVKRLI